MAWISAWLGNAQRYALTQFCHIYFDSFFHNCRVIAHLNGTVGELRDVPGKSNAAKTIKRILKSVFFSSRAAAAEGRRSHRPRAFPPCARTPWHARHKREQLSVWALCECVGCVCLSTRNSATADGSRCVTSEVKNAHFFFLSFLCAGRVASREINDHRRQVSKLSRMYFGEKLNRRTGLFETPPGNSGVVQVVCQVTLQRQEKKRLHTLNELVAFVITYVTLLFCVVVVVNIVIAVNCVSKLRVCRSAVLL